MRIEEYEEDMKNITPPVPTRHNFYARTPEEMLADWETRRSNRMRLEMNEEYEPEGMHQPIPASQPHIPNWGKIICIHCRKILLNGICACKEERIKNGEISQIPSSPETV